MEKSGRLEWAQSHRVWGVGNQGDFQRGGRWGWRWIKEELAFLLKAAGKSPSACVTR